MRISKKTAKELFIRYRLDPKVVNAGEWHFALNVELEHGTNLKKSVSNVTKDNIDMTARIAIAHFLEHPRYYFFLKKMEKEMGSGNSRSIFLP
jgi:hypothetical protein